MRLSEESGLCRGTEYAFSYLSGVGGWLTYEIACMSCGSALYSGFDLRSPNDILKVLGYKCKKCGAKLSPDKFKVEVTKVDGSFS